MLKTRIKEYGARYEISQEELAKLVNVRRETISHLERGSYNPSLKLAWDISIFFETTIEELFEYIEEEK